MRYDETPIEAVHQTHHKIKQWVERLSIIRDEIIADAFDAEPTAQNEQMHKTLGIGTVVAKDDKYITVELAVRSNKFMFPSPDTFTKFHLAEDASVQVICPRN